MCNERTEILQSTKRSANGNVKVTGGPTSLSYLTRVVGESIAALGELLKLRLGWRFALGALTAIGLAALWWRLRVLERSGRLPPVTDPSEHSLRVDLLYVFTSPILEVFSKTCMTLAVAGAAYLAGRQLSPELFSGFGPVVQQPQWVIFLEVLIFSDFVYYWVHRAAHAFPLLWRFHAVHHSTEHLRWTSALRAHPGEVYMHVVVALPLFLFGFPVDAFVAILGVSFVYSLVIHANVNVSAGRLGYLLNSPRFHAWHHSRDAKNGGTNFAGFFPFFDALFGTYEKSDTLPAEYGIDDPATPNVPEDFLAQLKYPFQRRRSYVDGGSAHLAFAGTSSGGRQRAVARNASAEGHVAQLPETKH